MRPEVASEAGADTRTRLLRAAAHLFARKGIDAVRNHEIHALAGQRNESAIHYHFGTKWGIVAAILDENELAALEILPSIEELDTVEAVVDFLVRRLALGLGTPHGRDWLRIVSELMARFPHRESGLGAGASEGLRAVASRLADLMPSPPAPTVERRATAVVRFMTAQMAARAQAVEDEVVDVSEEEFLAELHAMSLGMLTAAGRRPM